MRNLVEVCAPAQNDIAIKFDEIRGINSLGSDLRNVHFWAQMLHETGGLKWMHELGSKTYFAKYEPSTALGRRLGNTETGDGYKFRGRGLIQLTGRFNYNAMAKTLDNPDIINNPDCVSEPNIAFAVALQFWKDRGLSALADKDDIVAITRKINGGLNGLDDRKAWFERLKS